MRGIADNPVLAFNGGELSPKLDARVDLDKYASGCRVLENAVVEPYGAAIRRAGTQYIASTKVAGTKARLIGFRFSTSTNYLLEFGNGYIRFYSNAAQVTLNLATLVTAFWNNITGFDVGEYTKRPGPLYYRCISATPDLIPPYQNLLPENDPDHWQLVTAAPISEVASPYSEADLFELNTTQINDVVYITHPSHAPHKLARISADIFTLGAMDPYYPPLLDENVEEVKTLRLNDASITTNWATATAYVPGDVRDSGGVIYFCLVAHVSSAAFATDLALARWEVYNLLTASFAAFQAGHVGSYWQMAHLREASFVELEITVPADWVTATAYVVGNIRRETATNYVCLVAHNSGVFATDLAAGKWAVSEADLTSATIPVRGDWNVRTYGVWIADVLIQRSLDSGVTWETIRKFRGKEDRNVDATGNQADEAIFRVVLKDIDPPTNAGPTTPRVVIEVVDAYIYGLVQILGVIDSSNARVRIVDRTLSDDATAFWSEGAWSDARGFPRAVTLHEQRLCFGGTTFQPQTVWGSVTGDFENFKRGTLDTDSFAYTLGSTEFNAILWFVSQGRLLIGTTAGEWSMWSGDQGLPITPSSVKVDQHSGFGSKPGIAGMLVNDMILFVQRKGRRLRELSFSFDKDGYVAPDLTLLSEHVTAGGIVQMAYQGGEEKSVLWAVTGAGALIAMTYQRDQNVLAWHRHPTDGFVESVATIYGDGDDEVWMVVRRTVNGAQLRYVERINPFAWTAKEDCYFVDCGKTFTFGAATTAITGLTHLAGRTVDVLADGAVESGLVVTGAGGLTLANAASKVHVGLPFTTTVKPMRIDRDPILGNSQGLVKQVKNIVLRFLNTLGCQYGDGKAAFETLPFRDTDDAMDASAALFTGDKEVQFPGEFETEGDVVIRQTQPLPLTLIAIVTKHQVTGK